MKTSRRSILGIGAIALVASHCGGSSLDAQNLCEGTASHEGAPRVPSEHRAMPAACSLSQGGPATADGGAISLLVERRLSGRELPHRPTVLSWEAVPMGLMSGRLGLSERQRLPLRRRRRRRGQCPPQRVRSRQLSHRFRLRSERVLLAQPRILWRGVRVLLPQQPRHLRRRHDRLRLRRQCLRLRADGGLLRLRDERVHGVGLDSRTHVSTAESDRLRGGRG